MLNHTILENFLSANPDIKVLEPPKWIHFNEALMKCTLSPNLHNAFGENYVTVWLFVFDDKTKTITAIDCKPPHYSFFIWYENYKEIFI